MRTLIFSFLFVIASQTKAGTYYFSTTSGNDSRPAAQAMHAETPWQSLAKLNSILGTLKAGDSVLFSRGDVFAGSIVMSASGGSNLPIVFAAYGTGARPVITGLTTLTGWSETGNGTWETSCLSDNMVNTVLVNGVIKEIGRYPNITDPNKGYLTIKSAYGNTQITDTGLPASPDWTGGEVVIRKARWVIDRNQITRHAGNTIEYRSETNYGASKDFGYFIQNHPKTLDLPGEWYYRLNDHKLGIYLQSAPASYSVQASTVNTLVTINNLGNFVFDNISFTGANNKTFNMSDAQHVRISNCDILYSGSEAVTAKNTNGITIENSVINHSYNVALDLDNCSDLIIRNNKKKNTGMTAGMGKGDSGSYEAILLTGNNVLIAQNDIDSTGYIPIAFRGNQNTIQSNFINNYALVKDDAAGIYTWNNIPNSPVVYGTKITANIILHARGAGEGTDYPTYYPASGIYMDDNTFNAEITGNTVAECGLYGIYVHNAHDISLERNTFFNSRSQMVLREDVHASQSTVRNMRVFNNIFFAKEYNGVAEFATDNNDISQFGILDSNYYCRPNDERQIISPFYQANGTYYNKPLNLEEWKLLFGMDPNSKKSPVALPSSDLVRFEYNATANSSTVALDDTYVDVYNNAYTGSVHLKPYTSVVLMKLLTKSDTTPASTCLGLGSIDRAEWDNIPGNSISLIPLGSTPTKTSRLSMLETFNSGDSLGAMINGYVCPPLSGPYTFLISGDDEVELWFSTDDQPAHKKKIASIGHWTSFHEFTKFPSQKSEPVYLQAGQRYYIEVLHKEGDGGDHVTVAWQLPNGRTEAPIPGSRLVPFTSTVNTAGLQYRYYEGAWNTLPDFNTLTPVKTGNSPNVDLGERTPGRNDNFAFVWEGYINITAPGTYTFETVSDDGSKMYFNSWYNAAATATVTNDGLHAPNAATGTVTIPGTGMYPVSFTFFEKDGGEQMQVYWTGPGIVRQLIPNSAFTQAAPAPPQDGLAYKYYEGAWNTLPDFSTLTPVKTGITPNINLGERTPGRNDNFAFVWEGYINIPQAGTYNFETVSDDGSKFYFNSLYDPLATPIVTNDGLHAPSSVTGSVNIPAAGRYPVSITFFEKDGGEVMQLFWSGPGIARQPVPNSAFMHAPPQAPVNITMANRFTGHDERTDKTNAVMSSVYPNPFTAAFNISFHNASSANNIDIFIYDLKGRLVCKQPAGKLPKGNTTLKVDLDSKTLPPGIYMAGLKINGVQSGMVKLVKMK